MAPTQPPRFPGSHVSHPATAPPQFPGNDVPTAFSPSTFMSQLNVVGGLARQNRYMVIIPTMSLKSNSTAIFNASQDANQFPDLAIDWMTTYFNADINQEQLALVAFCEKSELPGYQYQMETTRHYGPAFKIPHLPEYQDITMTFLCGASMSERYFFDAWMYLVMDPTTNNFNYINEYAADITIVQFGETADSDTAVIPNYSTTLIDAFPVAVNPQELGFDLNNSAQKVSVTFTYKFAVPFTGKGSTSGNVPPNATGTSQPFTQTITPNVKST